MMRRQVHERRDVRQEKGDKHSVLKKYHKKNKITINHRHVSFGLAFVLIYVVSRHQYITWRSDTNDNKSQISGISATPAARAFVSAIKKRIGTINNKGSNNTWKLIDWDVPITVEEYKKFSCDFTTFESVMTKKSAPMCVHSFQDTISGYIRRRKHFGDCDLLPVLWNSSHGEQTDQSIYVEIGANIGSCVMEMLLGTNATIIAFEPHPMNVFNLKMTIMGLDKSYQDRIQLFPIGLGDDEGTNIIYSANNNMGNSVVGKIIKDGPRQVFDEKLQFQIYVEKLSSILNSGIDVKLLKMDAQGFECRILEGWGDDLARSIGIVRTEYATRWLTNQNCTDLVPRFIAYGFDVFRHYSDGHNFGAQLFDDPVGPRILDIFAVNKKLTRNA